MNIRSSNEAWGSRIGLILAMAGNAVGLANFLRFPSQAAVNGGGSFMVAYFVALVLLGIPLMWIEWGVGRNSGRFRKGHVPGMFAALWHHPVAKYLGVIGMVIPLLVMIYYTYIESWTLAFAGFSLVKDYWGHTTAESMSGYLQSFQGIGDAPEHPRWLPFVCFAVTLAANIWVLSKGISGGIEKLAKIAMPALFLFAIALAVTVLLLPPGPGGETAWTGLDFMYRPDFSRLDEPGVWLAAAGQIFFTLSVGAGSIQGYASYLSTKDDITLNALTTVSTNGAVEVVLGGTIAIPAAVVFFGVTGALAIAQSGMFNIGFVTMPVIFQQLPLGGVLGFLWFGLLFLAGITSSVAMLTPLVAFFREEFGFRRERIAWTFGGIILVFGMLPILWIEHGIVNEWDYWIGTLGLVVFAMIEVVLFMWVFKPENAWRSLHQGADLRLPRAFKFIMTYITPVYLIALLVGWGVMDAIPILRNQKGVGGGPPPAAEDAPYVLVARLLIVLVAVIFLVTIRMAWKRNRHDDRAGFPEVTTTSRVGSTA